MARVASTKKNAPAKSEVIPLDALKGMYEAWTLPGYTPFNGLTLAQIDRIAKAFLFARKYRVKKVTL